VSCLCLLCQHSLCRHTLHRGMEAHESDDGATIAHMIHRFRNAPPARREDREMVDQISFHWKKGPRENVESSLASSSKTKQTSLSEQKLSLSLDEFRWRKGFSYFRFWDRYAHVLSIVCYWYCDSCLMTRPPSSPESKKPMQLRTTKMAFKMRNIQHPDEDGDNLMAFRICG
jgi:hypothetical protein